MSDARRTLASDTTPEAEALQLRLWRSKSMAERLRLVGELCDSARYLAALGVRIRHPDADEDEVRMRVAATWLDRATMLRCYGWDPLAAALRNGAGSLCARDFGGQAPSHGATSTMTQVPDHVLVALAASESLEAAGLLHMVCGSIASSIHGEPRTTHDIDFVVVVDAATADRLCAMLEPEFHLDPEAVRLAVEHQLSCNAVHRRTAIKVDLFLLRARDFSRVELSRRVRWCVSRDPDRFLWVATPEDTLLSKLEWYRKGGEVSDRQWRDVLGLVRLQGEALDLDHIDRWCAELGVADLWARVRPGPPSNA